MQEFDLILKGAIAVVPHPQTGQLHEAQVEVGIRHGQITAVEKKISDHSLEILDLQGLHLLPGVIDSQVHFREPGLTHKEDLESGTRGALLGGVTAIFEMPNTKPSTTTTAAFAEKLRLAKNRCHVNYAFFMGAAPENAAELGSLERLAHCSAVKIFMGSSTGTLLVEEENVLEQILNSGKRRVAVHSEDEARLRERKHLAVAGGHPRVHPIWRDEQTAFISTQKLLRLARKTGRKVHVLHVTTAEEMQFLRGQKDLASVEILPQHLTFVAPDVYERWGSYAQMNPPIRESRHREGLWKAVLDGTVDVLASDHAPHAREEKDKPYPESPSGFPGVQTLVPVMLNHVHEGRLPLTRFVDLVTEGPARVYGSVGKGRIAVGFDADFTVVDLKKRRRIENSWIASRVGWSIYDGMDVTGWPQMTILGGQVAMREDQILLPSIGQPVNFRETNPE